MVQICFAATAKMHEKRGRHGTRKFVQKKWKLWSLAYTNRQRAVGHQESSYRNTSETEKSRRKQREKEARKRRFRVRKRMNAAMHEPQLWSRPEDHALLWAADRGKSKHDIWDEKKTVKNKPQIVKKTEKESKRRHQHKHQRRRIQRGGEQRRARRWHGELLNSRIKKNKEIGKKKDHGTGRDWGQREWPG